MVDDSHVSRINQGMNFKEQYGKECRKVKGTGKDIGHQKSYLFLRLLIEYKADKAVTAEDKKKVEADLQDVKLVEAEKKD